MVFSVLAIAGIGFAADVPRGSDEPTFNPGVGGPNTVVVTESKPVVFQGEDEVQFQNANGESVNPANLIGVAGDAEGIPLELPVPEDQELGQYAMNGQRAAAGVTVQTPRVTDLEIFNERGVDIEGASVPEDEVLLVRGEWNFQQAEDLDLRVIDENGNEVTGDVLVEDINQLSEDQLNQLSGPYADNPEQTVNPGQRGTGTEIVFLQGLGQFNESQLNGSYQLDSAFWAIDLSDQQGGDYSITVEGWDELDFGPASRTSTVTLTSETDVTLDLENDEATRGQNVGYTVRGSTAGAAHYLVIEDDDFRNNRVDQRVFRDVDNVVERGVSEDGNFAYAQVEIDEDTGLGSGQIDTTYLDDTNVDVNLYSEDKTLEDVAADLGDTEDDLTLSVEEGELEITNPDGTYIAGQDVDIEGTAATGVDDVAIYVRDQGDWELADINEDGEFSNEDTISVDSDGTWDRDDVILSRASDILGIPGRYRIGVIEVEDAVDEDGNLRETLTTSEFSSGTSEQTSIIVTEPGLGGETPNQSAVLADGGSLLMQQDDGVNETEEETYVLRTYNGQVATDDGTVDVLGVAPGLDDVLVVMIDSRGRVATDRVSVDQNDVFDEDDIALETIDGRELNEGAIQAFVFGLGRDTVAGDGVLPGQDEADLGSLENYIQEIGIATGLTQEQVTARILDETVEEAGSDDLFIEQTFRYTDAATSIESVVPAGTADVIGVQQIEVGETMAISGLTNRKPDDNTITVEVIDGPSADQFDTPSVDEWNRTGQWSVEMNTTGVEPGTYVIEADDGDNTDTVTVEIVPEGEGEPAEPTPESPETTEAPATTEAPVLTEAPEATPEATPEAEGDQGNGDSPGENDSAGEGVQTNQVGDIAISDLSGPDSVSSDQTYTVSATVTNEGDQRVSTRAEYRFAGNLVDRQVVRLSPGESATVEFEVNAGNLAFGSGSYRHGVFVAGSSQTTDITLEG